MVMSIFTVGMTPNAAVNMPSVLTHGVPMTDEEKPSAFAHRMIASHSSSVGCLPRFASTALPWSCAMIALPVTRMVLRAPSSALRQSP